MEPMPGIPSFPEGSESTPIHSMKPIIKTNAARIHRGNCTSLAKRRSRAWCESRVSVLIRAIFLVQGSLFLSLLIELSFPLREHVMLTSHPHVESGEQKNAHKQVGDEPAHNYDRERPLRVRSDSVGHGGW